ncbi:MAG: hypothetical protein M1817_005948 [Caeruleum heppii]|nr:MAG: hypothetical protein M1817_005948 [Caeruleum heppii]
MAPHQLPHVLPAGDFAGILSAASESFAFHASPQSFISSKVSAFDQAGLTPGGVGKHPVIRAKVLNRKVAVVNSYKHTQDILKCGQEENNHASDPSSLCSEDGSTAEQETFSAGEAYNELMRDFFPPPNLLLQDAPLHANHKVAWRERMAALLERVTPVIKDITDRYWDTALEGPATIDLYESMKTLSWRILLQSFLGVAENHPHFAKIEKLQEDLLRGQFSLFPVSVNAGMWRSARSRGLDARKTLQTLLKSHVAASESPCPFATKAKVDEDDVAAHLLLFTSSLAVKALASLLTATLLNLHMAPGLVSPAAQIRSLQDCAAQGSLTSSVLQETERLSPPVVGIMRRVNRNAILRSAGDGDNTLLPSGWDAWLYFVGASRDHEVFPQADSFVADRFVTPNSAATSFAFGTGSKECLGVDLVRMCVRAVADSSLKKGIVLQGAIEELGVRAWLGWESDVGAEAWRRDMKQLPTQRPVRPVKVTISQVER